MVDLWAHSANGAGVRHRLEDHLRGAGALAREFGMAMGAADLAGYLALVHDVGKAGCAWQQGLLAAEVSGKAVGLDHKLAGTWLARQAAGEFAMCVYGHHGGLGTRAGLKSLLKGASPGQADEWEAAAAAVAELVPEVRPGPPGSLLPSWLAAGRKEDPAAVDMLMRLVFSAVTDADFLDTEAHFQGVARPQGGVSVGDLAGRYEERREELLAAGGRGSEEVAKWRAEVYAEALEAAAGEQGVYRLASPTGSGKTIAAGGFAVHHARVHGLRRVIVAVPFISITEQNADVYRRLLDGPGGQVVLEHHSGADLDAEDAAGAWWRKLAAENWDAPFVVTTTAQLFHSLFDSRPSAMRKLHRLAGSVIVLDEVQALPDRLLLPILSALKTLTARFGATVLLASATQPAFWHLTPFQGMGVRNVVREPEPLYGKFRRVRYEWRLEPETSLADIAGEASGEQQVLAVVNTTADSAALHRRLQELLPGPPGHCLHLSTRMTAGHRRQVLNDTRELLDRGQPVAVVATQLIEAGVDVDFPVVYRAWAPADSLQQAAGRANRNGRLAAGRVVVFRPSDGGQPRDAAYKAALTATAAHFGPGLADPDNLEALERYYQSRYSLQYLNGSGEGYEIEKLRKDLDFPQVRERFRLIDERTVPVAVMYPSCDRDRYAEITGRLRSAGPQTAGRARQLLRDLRPYLATLPKAMARKAVDHGYAEPLIGDVLEWHAPYDEDRGIDLTELAELQSREALVF
jgi:CRISPR-associated endonuclease/helicase Cas3